MDRLTLDTFFSGNRDAEARQYHVLHLLKRYYDEFSHNRLYPSLSDLIDLNAALETLLQTKGDIESHLPQHLKEVDLVNRTLVYEPSKERDSNFERATELVRWALPLIKKAIDEGINIYNFTDDHIAIGEVGILPMYKEEGYCFVPDPKESLLHLLRYETSLFTSAQERFRTLKTRLLESVQQAYVKRPPESIKRELTKKYHDLPNPATYACDTDLDFPYAETILPIARRKLMQQVFS